MSEPDKQQFGDGGDQWGEAARNLGNAAKELGKEGAKTAAAGTAAGAANSSAALVKAGVEGSKAISEIAAGTAAGGPWGAVLSAAWSLRHTLYKILVCICLFFLILIVLLTSLPTIVTNQVFGLNGADMANPLTLSQSMTRLSGVVADTLEAATRRHWNGSTPSSPRAATTRSSPWKSWTTRRGIPLTMWLTSCAPTPFPWSSWVPARGYGEKAFQPSRQVVPCHLRGENSRGTGGAGYKL